MVNDAKGVNQIIFLLCGQQFANFFGIPIEEICCQSQQLKTLSGKGQALAREFYNIQSCSVLDKIRGIGPKPATDLEHIFPSPAWKLSKRWDVGLNEIFSLFNLLKILDRADGLGRMPDIAGPMIPVCFHLLQCAHGASPSTRILTRR